MITPSKEFWDSFKNTNGAFSTAEALALYNICLQAPKGEWLELGSHRGKSSQAIALAAQSLRSDVNFTLVEPEFKDTGWMNQVMNKVNPYLIEGGIGWYAEYSLKVIPKYESLSFVFVDSGVHDDMVMDEAKMLEDKMVSGGIIALHDFLNQFTAVERAYNYLLLTGKYERIDINWQEIFDYVKENNLEEGNISWHQYPELPHPPNFVGAIRRK